MIALLIAYISGILSGLIFGAYVKLPCDDFWVNFSANALSSLLIGILIFLAINRTDERITKRNRLKKALSMLKLEFTKNQERANQYITGLTSETVEITSLYPLRFTRGAWNALKQSGFLPQIDDTWFVYRALQLNEFIVIANRSLSKVRILSTEKGEKWVSAKNKALGDCRNVLENISPILDLLNKMDLPLIEMEGSLIQNEIELDGEL